MKTKIALVLLATAALSQAVIVQYSTTFGQAVVGATGSTPIPAGNGYTAVGYFSIPDANLATSTAPELAAAFVVWGASGTFGFGGFSGIYENVADGGRIGAGNQFLGKNIYIFNTNAATIAGSSQGLIFKSSTLFTQDDALPNPANPLVNLGASLESGYLFGGAAGPIVNLTEGVDVPSVRMGTFAVIPEPSAALLGALGALGLLRRRRI